MTDPTRWSIDEMLDLAGRGAGKVDTFGLRGATLVSMEEVAAMAAVLALSGLKPIPPGTYPAPNHVTRTEGERA